MCWYTQTLRHVSFRYIPTMKSPAISALSITGKRSTNEDRYLIETVGDLLIICVFDGHGGVEAAELTKRIFVEQFNKYRQSQKIPEALKQTFAHINGLIARQRIEGGTTATVAVINNDLLTISNVGDSKAVLYRNNQIFFKTTQHVLTNSVELSRYRSSDWFNTKSRLVSQGKLKAFKLSAISRSLGDNFFEDALSPIPDVVKIKLSPGDVCVIASDGLWNFMTDEAVGELVSRNSEPETFSEELVNLAIQSGSTDNITVIATAY